MIFTLSNFRNQDKVFLEGGICFREICLFELWLSESHMVLLGENLRAFFVFLDVTLDSAKSPFASPPLHWFLIIPQQMPGM